jgi:hypothetical protein
MLYLGAVVIPKCSSRASGDQSLGPKGLYLICISVHLLNLGVPRGTVLFINLIFYVLVLRLLLLLSR